MTGIRGSRNPKEGGLTTGLEVLWVTKKKKFLKKTN